VIERVRRCRTPLGWWAGIAAVLVVVQYVANESADAGWASLGTWNGWHDALDGWQQFDGHEYEKIARDGYWYVEGQRTPVVWFPLYPLLMRLVGVVMSDLMLAGMAITVVAGASAACWFWRWLDLRGLEPPARRTALAVLLLYPYGWYLFGPVHADALFVALAVGAFVLVERDRPVLAGVVGAFASATRPTGLAMAGALWVLHLERAGILRVPGSVTGWRARLAVPTRIDLGRARARDAGPLLALAGIGSYMTYQWIAFGHPLLFQINQRVYHPGSLPWLKRAVAVRWRDEPFSTYTLTITAQAVVVALVLAAVPSVARRHGFGYALYVASLAAIPTLSTEDFMGTGRYMMAAFPVAAVLGERLADRVAWRRGVLVASAALLVLLDFGFSRSWYLT